MFKCKIGITLAEPVSVEDLMNPATAAQEIRKSSDFLQMLNTHKSLLVIEDDLSLIQFIDTILEEKCQGIEWEYVTNGEAALELIQRRAEFRGSNPYSLVISDIFLAGELSGLDVWMECQERYPDMPFVITSHLSFDRYFSIVRGARNCPVYLPKPLTFSRCEAIFEEYF